MSQDLRLLHWPDEDRASFHRFVETLTQVQARVRAISGGIGSVPVPRMPRQATPREYARLILAHRRDLRALAGADGDMFGDPAWEILLALFQADVPMGEGELLSTVGFAPEAAAPRRWIWLLIERGWLVQEAGGLVLGAPAIAMLDRYFVAL